MAYYNGFPATYQPVYQYQPQQQSQNNSLIWVQGEAGAKSYLVAPNNTIALFDSESQRIFLKSADNSGMPSMKVLEYTIAESNKTQPNSASASLAENSSIYATKSEIDALNAEIKALRKRIEKMSKEDADE